MIDTVRSYIAKNQLLPSDGFVIVGLSGGSDSVALLHILVSLGYNCIAAHCNFKLRNNESERDELFSKKIADKLNVPFRVIAFETKQYASAKHLSIEMAARELRYSWFEELREEYKAQAIAVAHHRDDSVETLMINLTRGTGLSGLTGIRPRNGYVVRPMLSVSREDIKSYLSSKGLDYVTDSSNESDVYTRNFMRLRVIPLLEEINPSVKTTLARTADHLSEAEIIYKHVVSEAGKSVWHNNKLSIDTLLTYPAPKTILFELLRPYGFSRLVVDDIYASIPKGSGKVFYSPSFRLIKDRTFFIIDSIAKEYPNSFELDSEEGYWKTPIELISRKLVINNEFQIEKNKNVAYFDYEKLRFPLILRHWKEGDWFVPFGMTGKKKLSDYFSNNKFSLLDKENCWLLCSGSDIVWIVGERPDNRFRINKSTKTVLMLNFLSKTETT